MSGLTNDFLEKITSKLIPNFLGVYSANEVVSRKNNKSFSVIFNTGRLGTAGIHFVSLFVTKNILYYFDSFGDQHIQQDIAKFIHKLNRKCVMLCEPIQDLSSNFCGLYALAFLLWKKKNKSLKTFYSLFSESNLKLNDKIVTDYILNEIN